MRKLTPSFLLFLPLAAQDPNYRALRDAAPAETYRVENIELQRDVAKLTLRTGQITFAAPVLSRRAIAVFSGEGRLELTPVSPVDEQYIARLTGKSKVDETFDSAIFYFTDNTLEEVQKTGPGHGAGSQGGRPPERFPPPHAAR